MNFVRKQNVLGKLVIPRIVKSIQYIWAELEEQEREESFRLKRFKETKQKKTTIETAKRIALQHPQEKKEEEPVVEEPHLIKGPEPIEEPKKIEEGYWQEPEPQVEVPKPEHKTKKAPDICPCCVTVRELDKNTGKFVCPICKLASDAANTCQEIKVNMVPCQTCLPEVTENKQRLEHLMAHINQIIRVTKLYNDMQMAAQKKSDVFTYTTITEKTETIPYCLSCICARKRVLGTVKDTCTCSSRMVPETCPCDDPQLVEEPPCRCDVPQPVEEPPCLCDLPQAVEEPPCPCDVSQLIEKPPCSCEAPEPVKKPPCPCDVPQPVEEPLCSCNAPQVLEKPPCPCDAPQVLEKPPCPCDEPQPVEEPPCPCDEPQPVEEPPCPCDKPQPVEEPPCPCDKPQPVEKPPCPCDKPQPVEEPPCPCDKPQPVEEPPCPCDKPQPVEEPPCPCDKPQPVEEPPCPCDKPQPVEKPPCPCDPPPPVEKPQCPRDPPPPVEKSPCPRDPPPPVEKPPCPRDPPPPVEKPPCSCDPKPPVEEPLCICDTPPLEKPPCSCDPPLLEKPPCPCNPAPPKDEPTYPSDHLQQVEEPPCICDIPPLEESPCPCDTPKPNYTQLCHTHNPCSTQRSTNAGSVCPSHSAATVEHSLPKSCGPPIVASLPYSICRTGKASRIEKAPESHVGHTCRSKNPNRSCYPVCQGDVSAKIARASAPYLRPETVKQHPCKESNCSDSPFSKNNATFYAASSKLKTPFKPGPREGQCGNKSSSVKSKQQNKDLCPVCSHKMVMDTSRAPTLIKATPSKCSLCSNSSQCSFCTCEANKACLGPFYKDNATYYAAIPQWLYSTESSRVDSLALISEPCVNETKNVGDRTSTSFAPYATEMKPWPCRNRGTKDLPKITLTGFSPYPKERKPGLCPTKESAKPTRKPCSKCSSKAKLQPSCNKKDSRTKICCPYPVCLRDMATKITKASAAYLKPASSSQHTCNKKCSHAHSQCYMFTTEYTRDRKPQPDNRTDTINSILKDVATYVTTVPQRCNPYTREGRPGPCGIDDTNDSSTTCHTACAPYTREGNPGPCVIKATHKPVIMPYSREGQPGPCGLGKTMDTVKTHAKSYTREGVPGPCGIHGMYNTPNPKRSPIPYTREGQPGPCGLGKTMDTVKTHAKSYTREGVPGPCGIHGMYNTPNPKRSPIPYTREGQPGPCGLGKTMDTVKTHAKSYTREGVPGPCGIHGMYNTPNPKRSPMPYTREGKPGPCGISATTDVASPIKTHLKPYTREGAPGPCGMYGLSNTPNLIQSPNLPFTREGKPGPCGIYGMSHSANLNNTLLVPYTQERVPEPCGLDGMSNTPISTQSDILPYTRESKPGPCGIIGTTDEISPSDKMTPFFKDQAIYYVSKIPQRYTSINLEESSNIETPYSANKLRTTKSNISCTYHTTVPQKYAPFMPYTCNGNSEPCCITDRDHPSATSMSKDPAICFRTVLQQRTKYIREMNSTFYDASDKITTSERKRYKDKFLRLTKSLDSYITTSSKFSPPYADHSADYSPHLSDVYLAHSNASTVYLTNIPSKQSKLGEVNLSTEAKFSGNLSAPSMKHSTVTVNYVICQSNIQDAIKKASASYFKHLALARTFPLLSKIQDKIKEASKAYFRSNNCNDFQVNDMGAAIAKASAAYFKSAPFSYSSSINSMSTAVFRLPASSHGSRKSKTPMSGITTGYIPSWYTIPHFSPVPSGHTVVSGDLENSSSHVFKDICAPYFRTIQSSSAPFVFYPLHCMSYSCPNTCNDSSQYTTTVASSPDSTNEKPISPTASICSNCGKLKNPSTSKYSPSLAGTADNRACPSCSSRPSKISSPSKKRMDIGYLETEFKEITKVSRYKNPDGTVIDEKQIITIKTEKKTHQTVSHDNDVNSFDVGTCISCSQEYDIDSPHKISKKRSYECGPSSRDTKSDIVKGDNDLMASPKLKRSISAQEYNTPIHANILFGTWEAEQEIEVTLEATLLAHILEDNTIDPINNYTASLPTTNNDINPKCICPEGSPCTYIKPTTVNTKDTNSESSCICDKPLPCITSSSICANRLKDTDSGPKCICVDISPSPDVHNAPDCSCPEGSPCTNREPVCANRLEDTDSGPKCCCAENETKDDYHTDPKCICSEESSYVSTEPKSANRLEDTNNILPHNKNTDSGPECSCVEKSSSVVADTDQTCSCPEGPPGVSSKPVCANRVEDTDSGPKCSCPDNSPSTITHTGPISISNNPLHHSNTKCASAHGSSKLIDRVCSNREKDTDSGPKCSCAEKSSYTNTGLAHDITKKVLDNCLKCICPEGSLCLTNTACADTPKQKNSGANGDYGTSTTTLCGADTGLCSIRNTNSGSKCDCNSEHNWPKLNPKGISDHTYQPKPVIEKWSSSKYSTDCNVSASTKELLAKIKQRGSGGMTCLTPGSVINTDCSYNNSMILNSIEQSCIEYKVKSDEDGIKSTSGAIEYIRTNDTEFTSIRFHNVYCSTTELTPNTVRPMHSTPISLWKDLLKTNDAKESKAHCAVKLTRKPAKTRCCERKDEEGILFKGSFVEAIRKLLLLAKSPKQRERHDIPKICQSCYSPLSASFRLKVCPPPCATCKSYQAKSDDNYRCSEFGASSCTPSTRSVGTDIAAWSRSRACCLPNKYSSGTSTQADCTVAIPIKRTCESCSKYKNSDTSCLVKNNSTPNCIERQLCNKDTTTKSDRDDIRPIKKGKILHVCGNIRSNDHICHSESCISATASCDSVKKTHSCRKDFFHN